MRIIITANGEMQRQELKRLNRSLSMKHTTSMSQICKYPKISNLKKKKESYTLDKSLFTNDNILTAKHVIINQTPVDIRQLKEDINVEEMERLMEELKPMRDQSRRDFPRFISKPSAFLHDRQSISMKDIISNQTYSHMLTKLDKDQTIADNNYKMQDSDFRKAIHSYNKSTIDDSLSKEINRNSYDFIQYFKHKKEISPVFLAKVSAMQDSKVYGLNKICQIIHRHQNEEMLFQDKLTKRMKINKEIMISSASRSLIKMKEGRKIGETLFDSYRKKAEIKSERKINDYIYEKTQSCWRKYNVDHLQRTKQSFRK